MKRTLVAALVLACAPLAGALAQAPSAAAPRTPDPAGALGAPRQSPEGWSDPAFAPDPSDLRIGTTLLRVGWAGQGVMAIATPLVLRRGCDDRFTVERCSFRQIDGLVLGWVASRLTAAVGTTWKAAGVHERALHLRRMGYRVSPRRARWALALNALGFIGPAAAVAQRTARDLARLENLAPANPLLPPRAEVAMADGERRYRVPRRLVLTSAPLFYLSLTALAAFTGCHAVRLGGGTQRRYCREPMLLSAAAAGAAWLTLRGAALTYSLRVLRQLKALRRAGYDVPLRGARWATVWSVLFAPLGHALARAQRDRLLRFGPAPGAAFRGAP